MERERRTGEDTGTTGGGIREGEERKNTKETKKYKWNERKQCHATHFDEAGTAVTVGRRQTRRNRNIRNKTNTPHAGITAFQTVLKFDNLRPSLKWQ
jgi:hypothetical protein